MKVIFIILIIALILFLIYVFIKCKACNSKLLDYFKKSSVIVYGPKGSGKDLVFQKVIYLKRNKEYLSNCYYGYRFEYVPISELSTSPNTYESFIDGGITPLKKNEDFEGKDYYLSDGGVYLPCQYDYLLHKKYPSFPIFYALSRHLYNMNIHINTQNLSRIWKAPREQADKFIRVRKTIRVFNCLFTFIRFYDKYESAYNNLLPLGARSLNKYSKANADQYTATNGEIKNGFFMLRCKDIKYDTRFYHYLLFGTEFKNNERRKLKKNGRQRINKNERRRKGKDINRSK